MHYETEFFEKAEYLIKAVKKYLKKKMSVWVSLIKVVV